MSTIFSFISTHFHILGWSGVMALAGRLTWITFKGGSIFVNAKERILTAEASVNKMATNCLPTIQSNTEATNVKLDKAIEVLEEIKTGIAVLVDRGRS